MLQSELEHIDPFSRYCLERAALFRGIYILLVVGGTAKPALAAARQSELIMAENWEMSKLFIKFSIRIEYRFYNEQRHARADRFTRVLRPQTISCRPSGGSVARSNRSHSSREYMSHHMNGVSTPYCLDDTNLGTVC